MAVSRAGRNGRDHEDRKRVGGFRVARSDAEKGFSERRIEMYTVAFSGLNSLW